jgi:pilus assembly protein CpaC
MHIKFLDLLLLGALAMAGRAHSGVLPPAVGNNIKPCNAVSVDDVITVTLGKTTVLKLNTPVVRMVIGGMSALNNHKAPENRDKNLAPAVPASNQADGISDVEITLLSPNELFILGKATGAMNVVLQSADGHCRIRDVIVTIDPSVLQNKLTELMPEETGIKVKGAENALVLIGKVSDAIKLDEVMNIATSYGNGKRVVNLLRIMTPQQVMLEVKIAEVSKTLLDKFGIDFARLSTSADGLTSRIVSGILGGGPAVFGQFSPNTGGGGITGFGSASVGGSTGVNAGLNAASQGATLVGVDAQKKDGLIRILAEPNIMAISGQSASFLSGGKILIPVAQGNNGGGPTVTLEEKEFGVGLKFTPTVLDGTRINLKFVTEVSELSQTGSPFTTVGGVTSVLPSIATRRVDTTVQLNDGQSFAVAGLIRHNVTESISRFPGLGEIPVVGALFRSSEFQKAQTELLFIVTPRLVRPISNKVALPTDHHVAPEQTDVILMGKAEGVAAPVMPTPPTSLR